MLCRGRLRAAGSLVNTNYKEERRRGSELGEKEKTQKVRLRDVQFKIFSPRMEGSVQEDEARARRDTLSGDSGSKYRGLSFSGDAGKDIYIEARGQE